ncbi:RAMP superfamily CRISPR-associated protein [Nocardiopsis sp. NPDC006938]|uniref:RAMP superfamily CRISPR-associated protein n=1 Tax=Nocardiopsis sp. NPDC006938 TaxID=3364337 RepID=UPI00368D2DBA
MTGAEDPHGPGATRVVWEFAVRLGLLTDTHVGAARATPRHVAESDVDLRLDRDPRTGVPRLRGTTLAGLLRHELLARTADPESAVALLGSGEAEGAGARASAVDLDDAHADLPEGGAVTVRVGTRVDPASGSVRPGLLWQWEVLPAGTVFTAHLRLRSGREAEEAHLLGLLARAARGLADEGPGIRIGARTGRGHGAVRAVRWAARRYDLTEEPGWFAYHARDWRTRWREAERALTESPLDGEPTGGRPEASAALDPPWTPHAGTDLADLVRTVLRAGGATTATAPLHDGAIRSDRRRRAELRLELRVAEHPDPAAPAAEPLPGTLLIGDPPAPGRAFAADRVHRRRPAVTGPGDSEAELSPVLGDTALFSLVKRVGGRLVRDAAEHLAVEGAPWRAWHAHWWGDDTAAPPGSRPAPSRIRLRSTPVLTGGAAVTTTRLTVDPLFGDAVDGHLFTAELHSGGAAEAVLDVAEPDDAVLGMLALVVRELATVPLDTLGAGAGTGAGRLLATRAVLVTFDGSGAPPRETDLLRALSAPAGPDAATVRGWLPDLHRQITRAPDPGPADEGTPS